MAGAVELRSFDLCSLVMRVLSSARLSADIELIQVVRKSLAWCLFVCSGVLRALYQKDILSITIELHTSAHQSRTNPSATQYVWPIRGGRGDGIGF